MSGPKLGAQPAVLRATITIKRAATGKVETYAVTGTPAAQPLAQAASQSAKEA